MNNEIVKELALRIGFDLVGFAKADALDEETAHLKGWLAKGYQAGMKYMERNTDKRKEVREILPDAKSVISLALNYYTPVQHSIDNDEEEIQQPEGKISRYAWGRDYHLVIWEKLDLLEKELSRLDPDFKSISYVDTGPVMDKAWAVRAGIGWQGKHTNVINPGIGSWFFIANLITNYEFDYSQLLPDHCGSCTACIDACPTQAIVDEYVVDSGKCISYLTIENKGEISPSFEGKFDNWVFGCDICQDVCPWNIKFSESCGEKEFYPKNGKTGIRLSEIAGMSNKEFNSRFKESPVKRTKLSGLKRNALFILHSRDFKNHDSNS